MASSKSALDSLRTVEFRETLKGYHRDDVDEYLEKAAVEAEGLQEQLRQTSERLRQAGERISQLEVSAEPQLGRYLQLGDAFSRLAEALTRLSQLLLEAFGFDRGLLQVFVHVVPVIPLEGLTELDGP